MRRLCGSFLRRPVVLVVALVCLGAAGGLTVVAPRARSGASGGLALRDAPTHPGLSRPPGGRASAGSLTPSSGAEAKGGSAGPPGTSSTSSDPGPVGSTGEGSGGTGSTDTSASGGSAAGSGSGGAATKLPYGVVVPEAGGWRYRVEGSRKIGTAGLARPFAEDVTVSVAVVDRDALGADVALDAESSQGSQSERRRYSADRVELVSLRLSSGALSYGGRLEPAPQLIRWPVRVGDTWSGSWRSSDGGQEVEGSTTSRVTAERSASMAGRSYRCFLVESDTVLSGAVVGDQHQKACWVAELGMSVDDEQRLRGRYQGVAFEAEARLRLLAPPG